MDNELETPASGIDMDAALASIETGLGFKSEEPAEDDSQEAAASPEPQPQEEPSAEPPPPAPEDAAPDTWTKDAKEKWATIPPDLRQEIRKREADIAKHVASTNEAVNVGKQFEKIVSPYLGALQQHGINPWTHTEQLLRAHAVMMLGQPQEKVAMFRQLALDAGIDPAGLAQEGNAAAENPMAQHIAALQKRINQLEQGVTGVTSSVQAARAAELEASVLAFAQDEAKHPYFYDVVDDIQHLIATKAATTLEKAYELAVLANPLTRQKMLDGEMQKRLEAQAVQDKERAEKARKAATGTVKANGRGRAAPPLGTIDDTLREALANIHSRSTN